MARKLTYNVNRFDGGMTDDIRNLNDLSKCAFVSHMDIYEKPHLMRVMPGFESFDRDSTGANGARDFNIRGIWYDSSAMYGVGNNSSKTGTGAQLYTISSPLWDGTDEWSTGAFSSVNATEDLWTGKWMPLVPDSDINEGLFVPLVVSGDLRIRELVTGSPEYDIFGSTSAGTDSTRLVIQKNAADLASYSTDGSRGINQHGTRTITQNYHLSTGMIMTDAVDIGNYFYAIGYDFYPYVTQIYQLRIEESTASDRNIQITQVPNSRGGVVGKVGNSVVAVTDDFIDTVKGASATTVESNTKSGFTVRALEGTSMHTIYQYEGPFQTASELWPTKGTWKDGFTFYASYTDSDSVYRSGIWAVSRRNTSSPVAVSLLVDTSSLETEAPLISYNTFGNHQIFIWDNDTNNGISRLGDYTGSTFDVTASYESLMYGSESPNQKQLNGVNVVTEALPASSTVELSYRTSPSGSWTSMGTSTTAGDTRHTFTRASGVPIGNFEEIQFKVDLTGKIVVTGLHVSLTELDDIAFNS